MTSSPRSCHLTQVINAVGAGINGDGSVSGGGQASGSFGGDRARRRFRRNQNNTPQKTPPEIIHKTVDNDKNTNVSSLFGRENQHRRRQPHQYNWHHSRRRRSGDIGGSRGATLRRQYGGWVDAAVGGAGGGVPSTGGDLDALSTAVWWSTADTTSEYDGTENFAGDDGYAGIAGVGDAATGAGYIVAALTRRGWETGDKELAPRVPVFAADGQGYVSVAPVRNDDAYGMEADDEHRDSGEGGVRLRRPSPTKQNAHDRNATNGPSSVRPPVGKYYAQVVAVNITKKLLAPLTFGEPDNSIDNSDEKNQKKKNVITKNWMVIRILAWDQRTNLIYFLAVPSGRGAPHYRHLYAVKFTSPAYSWTATSQSSTRSGHHYQQQYRKTIHHSTRNRPTCLSCDIGSIDNTLRRDRRDVGGKQNRMDEARDDRLRQQQRERWEHQKEEEEADKKEQAATAEEEDERSQQQNRQRKHKEIQNRGTRRHCTYYDAQFSRDGSHYALICLGPSVPYVTLHRTMTADSYNDIENNDNDSGSGEIDSAQHITQKSPTNNSSYTYEFIALIENNTRLQDKYTNRVLLPDTRTFQLRLSGGRKLTTSGGLHFNDPLAAADYYSNGGGQQLHFSARKRTDSDPLTVAQVRLYLPLGVYDPEADPRPEFMSNYVSSSGGSVNHAHHTIPKVAHDTNHNSLFTQRRRRRRSSSSSHDNKNDNGYGLKRQRRPYKQQRKRRYKKLYPMLVVLNSDPGSQAITDRFTDRLGYTTGLLCSGSLGRTLTSTGGGTVERSSKYNENKRDRRRNKERRNRRSATTWYYSSSHLENDYDNSHDYEQYDDEDTNNNEYVVAVIDPGRGTWARGYESLMALNYNVGNDRYEDNDNKEENESGGLLGTADIRDQMEAVEYLLSSATTTDENYKDTGQGYYSEDRPRGGRGSRDRSRWFSSSSQSNRRYFSDDDDYYDNESEYSDNNDKNYDDDYYYYYYSNGGDNSDYGDGRREDSVHRDGNEKRGRRDRRSTSDTKSNSEALRLPYVDATRVALLGGGPTSPSAPSSIYGGYAAARMALWQSKYGGAPIEKKVDEVDNDENRKEPVAIHSSFKCAITMAPVYSWRLYASAFAERYYGYYGKNDGDNWISYDRSDLIPFIVPINGSSFSPSSNGKGINLLVMHGTADTSIHPQHSMMLVRGVMQQQQQYAPNGIGGNHGRRNNNSTTSGGRISNGLPFKVGAIRISQLALPDVDLSNMRMVTGVEHGSPIHYQHQLLHSIYSHVTQYLANECFTSVRDGSRGRGIRVHGRALRKRRRRRWRTGNRDQEDLDDQQQQLQRDEYRQQYQKNQLSVSNSDNISGGNGRNHNNGGRYRRHNIDDSHILENKGKNDIHNLKIKTDDHGNNNNNKSNSVNWNNSYLSTLSNNNNNKSNKISNKKTQEKNYYAEEKDEEIENDNGNNHDYNSKKNYKEKDKNEESDDKK